MYWDDEINSEEKDEIIRKIAERVHGYGMDVPAILFLESVKPLSYIGSQMGRMFVSPFLPIFGDDISLAGDKLLQVFENRESVEEILSHLEELTNEENQNTMEEKENEELGPRKEGWRRFLPF